MGKKFNYVVYRDEGKNGDVLVAIAGSRKVAEKYVADKAIKYLIWPGTHPYTIEKVRIIK